MLELDWWGHRYNDLFRRSLSDSTKQHNTTQPGAMFLNQKIHDFLTYYTIFISVAYYVGASPTKYALLRPPNVKNI